ncbi:MAG TPA: HU family DNA-binding protein [bacterium]|nr:HU family DNA-binding protein [bacterium]
MATKSAPTTVNKADLVDRVANATGLSGTQARAAVEAMLDEIGSALKAGDEVRLTGFGTFAVRQRAARTGKNPKTGESIAIKASKVPAFRPGADLKKTVA